MTEDQLVDAYGGLAAQEAPGAAEPATGVPVAIHAELRALAATVAGLWGHLDARLDALEDLAAHAAGLELPPAGSRAGHAPGTCYPLCDACLPLLPESHP